MLETIALILAAIHFSIPLAYYCYAKTEWLPRAWNIKFSNRYRPKVTIIVPTHNEADIIEKRLENIYRLDYPKEKIEVIVADDGSSDGTPDIVEKWAKQHCDLKVKVIKESLWGGKLRAVIKALKQVNSEIIVLTDADAFWSSDSLKNSVKYFADPCVGAVTACIKYAGETIENCYRSYFNIIRVAESKFHSTPIHNGPFMAIRAEIIREIGLPIFPGSDDSHFGSYIAFAGYRAVQADDIIVEEVVRGTFKRKIRRALRLLINFKRTKNYVKNKGVYVKTSFEKIWKIEQYLHLVNPWILMMSISMLLVAALSGSLISLISMTLGILLLLIKIYRIWILQQLYLVLAAIKSLWTREVMWSK